MSSIKMAFKKAKAAWAARPRSLLEYYEFSRDDILLTPRCQWVIWWTGCFYTWCELAAGSAIEFCLMMVLCYIIFTLPCLRFCTVWTRLYQARRHAVPPPEDEEAPKEKKQKKKKAMTEEEMLEATRKRQKNRPGGIVGPLMTGVFLIVMKSSPSACLTLAVACDQRVAQRASSQPQRRKRSAAQKEQETRQWRTTSVASSRNSRSRSSLGFISSWVAFFPFVLLFVVCC